VEEDGDRHGLPAEGGWVPVEEDGDRLGSLVEEVWGAAADVVC
jgi:hypothetical protein